MKDMVEDACTLESSVWEQLQKAVTSHRAAFHSGALASTGLDGSPQLRTVILRAADPVTRTLAFHTDRRSPKFAELCADPRLGWLFYDEPTRTQLRITAVAELHTDDAQADHHWAATTLDSRRAYAALDPPSSALIKAGDGLPDEAGDARWTLAFSERYRPNFAVVVTHVSQLEVLRLSHQGHRRIAFEYGSGAPPVQARWLTP